MCQGTYRGTTPTCAKKDCKGKAGTGYFSLAKKFAEVMDSVVAMDAPVWDGKDMFPEVLSPTKLCEILLTPRGNQLSGMQAGAWALPAEDEGKCSCHGGEEAMDTADQENNTIDCSSATYAVMDVSSASN